MLFVLFVICFSSYSVMVFEDLSILHEQRCDITPTNVTFDHLSQNEFPPCLEIPLAYQKALNHKKIVLRVNYCSMYEWIRTTDLGVPSGAFYVVAGRVTALWTQHIRL